MLGRLADFVLHWLVGTGLSVRCGLLAVSVLEVVTVALRVCCRVLLLGLPAGCGAVSMVGGRCDDCADFVAMCWLGSCWHDCAVGCVGVAVVVVCAAVADAAGG
jgi:hypothetical protein